MSESSGKDIQVLEESLVSQSELIRREREHYMANLDAERHRADAFEREIQRLMAENAKLTQIIEQLR